MEHMSDENLADTAAALIGFIVAVVSALGVTIAASLTDSTTVLIVGIPATFAISIAVAAAARRIARNMMRD